MGKGGLVVLAGTPRTVLVKVNILVLFLPLGGTSLSLDMMLACSPCLFKSP